MADSARAALEAVAREINGLESLCIEIDAAVTARDWGRLERALADSAATMQALEGAMAAAVPYRDEQFDRAAYARLQQIYTYRQERLDALQQYHDEVGERLRALSRWKSYARSLGTPRDFVSRQQPGAIDGLR